MCLWLDLFTQKYVNVGSGLDLEAIFAIFPENLQNPFQVSHKKL